MNRDFFRKYLDILSEAAGTQQDIEKTMGNLGVSPEELAARQAQDAATPEQTPLQKAQERGQMVQGMTQAGLDQKTIDMVANDDLEGLANQAAGAVQGLPSKAEMQKMAQQGMASKEFASLPKDQQDAYRAQFSQLDDIPDDYRQQGAQNFKQIGQIGAQEKADKKAGTGMYDPSLTKPITARVEKRYTPDEAKQAMDREMASYAAQRGDFSKSAPVQQTNANVRAAVTAPVAPTTNTQAAGQPVAPAAPAQPTTNTQRAPQPTAPTAPTAPAQPTTEEELEEELQKILRLSGRQKQTTNENDSFKKFYSVLNESMDNDEVDLHDSFDIELNEHFVIETGVVGFTKDGIIVEADETLLDLLELNSIICEDETMDQREEEVAEAEYQGRKVPLGKPMKGDVAKSKVYVKKPNGKVVKVNFGDKNMKIKKSNPNRRKSFRARHRCENPGPRWKARYWSCRAW